MDQRKKQLIEELIAHLEDSQGGDLAALMEESKPKPMEGLEAGGEVEKPEGVSIEKVEIEAKPEGEEPIAPEASESPTAPEMSDDELAELLKKYL
jgi:hypothetical protein